MNMHAEREEASARTAPRPRLSVRAPKTQHGTHSAGQHSRHGAHRGELRAFGVVGGQVVLDLLEGELGDADRGADAFQASAGAAGHRVVALVVAMSAATVSKSCCQAESRWKAPSLNQEKAVRTPPATHESRMRNP
ncbi:hypothetical protein GCM10012280_49760 [Wenjunlia tyrosinilytica]|uniref:Uncharacterized protein n=1 Tax=Wenjunlia tyrosinilytica TaxID=1544741 RepID=A0A917ZUH6_9ACTN|nr:hypothetical protein GCM10012280_49760 [Wenjunlia tyrosinilytica]